MAANRDAEYLVEATLDLVQLNPDLQDSPVRRGFIDDQYRGRRTSVLRHLNNAIRKLVWTGYHRCYVDVEVGPADGDDKKYEYGFPRHALRVTDTTMMDPDVVSRVYHIESWSLEKLNKEHPGWRYANTGQPTIVALRSDILHVFPPPDRVWRLSFLADTVPSDLVNKVDPVLRMPTYFHDDIPYGAAIELSRLGAIHPAAVRRLGEYKEEWARAFKELREVSENRDDQFVDEIIIKDLRDDWR